MMYRQSYQRRTPFFAILLSVSVLLSAFVFAPPVAEADSTPEYRYTVSIEFGPMTFYYDWGTWNSSEMRYVAASSSENPANGTVQGYPGWYGFDGTANKISIQYSNAQYSNATEEAVNQNVNVKVAYEVLSGTNEVSGISMSLFQDQALTESVAGGSGNSYTLTVPNTYVAGTPESDLAKTTVYLSLSGVPKKGGSDLKSETFTPVGVLTITIGNFSD